MRRTQRRGQAPAESSPPTSRGSAAPNVTALRRHRTDRPAVAETDRALGASDSAVAPSYSLAARLACWAAVRVTESAWHERPNLPLLPRCSGTHPQLLSAQVCAELPRRSSQEALKYVNTA